MDGTDLSILYVDGSEVVISDGERSAVYVPRDEALSGSLSIVPHYVEAGWFSEANAVTLTNGIETAIYLPRGR